MVEISTGAPTVSIVMPVFNRAAYLDRAVDSLLAQTLTSFELILVDDGSVDGSLELMQAYADRDPRVRVFRLPANGGQGLARALGNDVARGEYLAVMDSDDVAVPERLERQVAFLREHPDVTLCGGCAVKVQGDLKLRMVMPISDAEIKARLLLVDAAFVHPTVMMRRAFLKTHNLNYSSERRGDDDYEFYNRMVQAGAVFANLPDILLEYHRHGGNISANSPRLQQDKTPLRQFLLQLYYPDLTGREVRAIADLMQVGVTLNARQVWAGVLATEKAMTMMVSQCGEDHRVLNGLLSRTLHNINQLMTQQRHGR